MVKGLDTFCKYFATYADQYVLLGGAACDGLKNADVVVLLRQIFG